MSDARRGLVDRLLGRAAPGVEGDEPGKIVSGHGFSSFAGGLMLAGATRQEAEKMWFDGGYADLMPTTPEQFVREAQRRISAYREGRDASS